MATLQGAQTLIAAKIQAVAGVGRVYEYQRLVTDESSIVADMRSAGVLNYWTVTPAQANPHALERHPGTHAKATYQYDVHGFYAAKDYNASEVAFVALVVAVMATFETGDKKLGGAVTECWPAQWQEHDYRMLAGVLCHHARLAIAVREHPAS